MSNNTIYILIAAILFFAYKKIRQMQVLKLIPAMLNANGVIVDVRSEAEFAGGSVLGSLNIPISIIKAGTSGLDKNSPVILCCTSGTRSGMAKIALQKMGFQNVVNGGPWGALRQFEK